MLYFLLATVATFSCVETQSFLDDLADVPRMSIKQKTEVAAEFINATPTSCGFSLEEYIASINDA